jgi:DNA polymerase elongation subunit (family B)
LDLYYLIDGSSQENAIVLSILNGGTGEIQQIRDETYKPYFLAHSPLTTQEESILQGIGFKKIIVEKTDLFSDERRMMTRIEMDNPAHLSIAFKLFEEKWEDRIPYLLSYVYDRGLVFGASYSLEGVKLKPAWNVSESLAERFNEKFSSIKTTDPAKYEMLEHWFTLCFQPVPQVPLKELGITDAVDYEKVYLTFLLSRVANLPLPEAFSNRQVSTWIRSILHFYLRRKNILIPRSSELRRGQNVRGIPGALTFQPKAGTYFDTVVVDFESLYPSLIDSYNLSFETVDCNHEECGANQVPEEKYHVCTRRRGVYSILTGALKDLRIHWFKPLSKDSSISTEERRLAEAASRLLKLILVSSYGVTVRIHGLAQPALAESITAYGRHSLRQSWRLAEEEGLKPLYGDTDSLFLDSPLEENINRLIFKVKKELRLDLAVDKIYSVCVLPRAMKAYFGIRKDGTADVKGLTAIKSNSPPFIRNVFMDCVKELVAVKNWTEFEAAKDSIREVVKRAVTDLQSGKVRMENLVYTVKLHFDASEKTAEGDVYHQPYQCAVQLADRQKKVSQGEVVSFVKVKPFNYRGKTFSVKPVELVKDFREVNMDDYVRNLRTALNQTFKPMNLSFDEEPKTTLADFI